MSDGEELALEEALDVPELETPSLDIEDDLIQAVEESAFYVGGKPVYLGLMKSGKVSSCFDDGCQEIGQGQDVYQAVKKMLESLGG